MVDLVSMRALYFDGANGEERREEEIPADLLPLAQEKREELIDAAAMFSDELTEAALEEKVTAELLIEAVRKGTITREMTPVFMGSAYKNKGVQPLSGRRNPLPALPFRHQQPGPGHGKR